jgi:hypothetical protein
MPVGPASDPPRDVVVAHVRERPGMDFVEVMFLESARIFHLSRSHEHFDHLLTTLREAHAAGRSLRVTLAAPHSGDIDDVQYLQR